LDNTVPIDGFENTGKTSWESEKGIVLSKLDKAIQFRAFEVYSPHLNDFLLAFESMYTGVSDDHKNMGVAIDKVYGDCTEVKSLCESIQSCVDHGDFGELAAPPRC